MISRSFLFGLGLLPFWVMGGAVAPAFEEWHTDYEQSRELAIQQQIPLIVFFGGSDWCVWCQKMATELFSDGEFREGAGRDFVAVELDFPHNQRQPVGQERQNRLLKAKFGVESFPTVLWVDPKKEDVFYRHGYLEAEPVTYGLSLHTTWMERKRKRE